MVTLLEKTLSSSTFDLSEISQGLAESTSIFVTFIREIPFSPVTVPPWSHLTNHDRMRSFFSQISLSEISIETVGVKEAALEKVIHSLLVETGKFLLQQENSNHPTWRFADPETYPERAQERETFIDWPDGKMYYRGTRLVVSPFVDKEILLNPEDWGRSSIEIDFTERHMGPSNKEMANKLKPINESLFHKWELNPKDPEASKEILSLAKRHALFYVDREYLLQARMFLTIQNGFFRETE